MGTGPRGFLIYRSLVGVLHLEARRADLVTPGFACSANSFISGGTTTRIFGAGDGRSTESSIHIP